MDKMASQVQNTHVKTTKHMFFFNLSFVFNLSRSGNPL